jgi:hypothetical protein
MSTLTMEKSQTMQEKIFDLLKYSTWSECKHQVKHLYQKVKNTLAEQDQEELLLDIYLETLADDDYTNYWNYMNKAE